MDELRFKIVGDTRDAIAAFEQARAAVKDLVSSATTEFSKISQSLKVSSEDMQALRNSALNTAATFTGALVLGATAVAASLYSMAKQAADADGRLVDLSTKSGLSVETLSALDVAAKQSGGSLENVAHASVILQHNLGEAQKGNEKLTQTFKALNVDIHSSAEEALPKIFKALNETEDQGHKTALAMQVFGRSGADLLPLIDQIGGDVDGFKAKMAELGLVVGTDAAKAADEFGDKLTLLDAQMEALKRRVGEQVIPSFIQLIGLLDAFRIDPKGFLKDFGKDLMSLPSQLNKELGLPDIFSGFGGGTQPFDNIISRMHTAVEEAKDLAEQLGQVGKEGADATDKVFRPSADKGPNREAARERLEKELDRIRIRNAQVTTENLRDNEVLRAATEGYIRTQDIAIERYKGFVELVKGQAELYKAIAATAIAAQRQVLVTQYETSKAAFDLLSTYAGNEVLVIKGRAKLRRQEEDDRHKAVVQSVKDQLDANQLTQADDAATRAVKLAAQQQLNRLLEEEAKLHKTNLAAIDRGEKVDTERATPGSVRNILGDRTADELGAAGEQLKGFAAITAGVRAQVSADLKAMGNAGAQPLQVLGGMTAKLAVNMAQAGFAALVSGRSIGQAMRQAAAAGIAAIAQLAAVEAVKNLAWGLHAAGLTFIPGYQSAGGAVPNFFASAAAWGSLAAGAGVVGAALSRGSGSGGFSGGGALGNALTGTRQDDSTRSTEDRIRFTERDARGQLTGDVRITLVTDTPMMATKVEGILSKSYNQGGTMKQITDHAVSGIPITPS